MIRAKATHFRVNSSAPMKTSKIPNTFKTYPVAAKEVIKEAALSGNCGNGIRGDGSTLFSPNTTKMSPSTIRTILVNIEFIIYRFIGYHYGKNITLFIYFLHSYC